MPHALLAYPHQHPSRAHRKLREETAQISERSRLYLQSGQRMPGAAADQERRVQRLQAILEESKPLTD